MHLHTSRCQHALRTCHVHSTIIVLLHWYQLCNFSNKKIRKRNIPNFERKWNDSNITKVNWCYFISHSHGKSLWFHCWRGIRFQQRQTARVRLLDWDEEKESENTGPHHVHPLLLLIGIWYLYLSRWELEVTSKIWECEWKLNIPRCFRSWNSTMFSTINNLNMWAEKGSLGNERRWSSLSC